MKLVRQRQKDIYTNALTRWILGLIPRPQPTTPSVKPAKKETSNPTVKKSTNQIQLTLQPIEIETVEPIQLREYQQEAVNELLKRKKGTITHATGLGKTFVALEAIRRIGPPVAIFVPTIAIMEQVWLRRLKQMGWKNVGVFYGHKHQLRPITIFLYQSAIRHPEAVATLNPKLIIFDEIHHTSADEWSKLLPFAEKSEYALGLTATLNPWEPKNYKIVRIMPIIHTMPIGEARREGWVPPIKVYSAPAPLSLQERVKYEEYNEIIRRTAIQLGTTDPTVWSKLAKNGDPIARKGLWAMAKRRMLLSEIKSKLNILLHIIKSNPDSQIILFSEGIKSVEVAKQFLTQHGIKCETYHSEKPKNLRQQILRAWEQRQFNTLLSCVALEEGVDVPDASVAIFLASGKSPRKLVQRVGRILRKAPGKIARVYVIWGENTVERDVLTGVIKAVSKVK